MLLVIFLGFLVPNHVLLWLLIRYILIVSRLNCYYRSKRFIDFNILIYKLLTLFTESNCYKT